MEKDIVFKANSIQGDPWKKRSNQSINFTRSPSKSIIIFSTTWGGENGASPRVKQKMMIIPIFI
jgi:hypothetical protein